MKLRINLSEEATRRLINLAVRDRRPVHLEAEHLLEQLLLGGQSAEAQPGREGEPCGR